MLFRYGDKAPRSLIARCIALVWILIGIVVFSLFTASLTTILASASENEAVEITGKKVILSYTFLKKAKEFHRRSSVRKGALTFCRIYRKTLVPESLF